jgi:hypothetical protein
MVPLAELMKKMIEIDDVLPFVSVLLSKFKYCSDKMNAGTTRQK